MEDQVDQVEETVEESEEVIQEMSNSSQIWLDGLVLHEGTQKEELARPIFQYSDDRRGRRRGRGRRRRRGEEQEAMHHKKMKKESIDQVVDSLDVSDDVETQIVEGEELSEEFKTKATIFESAVKSKVRAELEKNQRGKRQSYRRNDESTINDMTEKVDDYLNYVVEQWMEENQHKAWTQR